MPPASDIPLSRTNLNLFAEDKITLYRRYGNGWTEVVRDLVHAHVKQLQEPKQWPTIASKV